MTGSVGNIPYTIVRSARRKTVGITVAPDDTVTVRAPVSLRDEVVARIVAGKADWIRRRFAVNQRRGTRAAPRTFADGEEFPFLGTPYRIERVAGAKGIAIVGDRLCIGTGSGSDGEGERSRIAGRLERWCRAHARSVFAERTAFYAGLVGAKPNAVRLKTLKSRWGSCSRRGNLNFNWTLVLAPREVIDYVVAHEVCHFEHPDHSAAFWALVESLLPDYRERRAWLRRNGSTLRVE